MKPIHIRIQGRSCLFMWKAGRSSDPIFSKVFSAVRNDHQDKWNKQAMEFIEEIGKPALVGPKRVLKKIVLDSAVEKVLVMKRDLSSLAGMPQPRRWFSLLLHINSSVVV